MFVLSLIVIVRLPTVFIGFFATTSATQRSGSSSKILKLSAIFIMVQLKTMEDGKPTPNWWFSWIMIEDLFSNQIKSSWEVFANREFLRYPSQGRISTWMLQSELSSSTSRCFNISTPVKWNFPSSSAFSFFFSFKFLHFASSWK